MHLAFVAFFVLLVVITKVPYLSFTEKLVVVTV